MVTSKHYDVIVLGSGPSGEGAAINAAKQGKSVAVVEKFSAIGGSCTHFGTIPSKTLRHAITQLIRVKSNPLFKNMQQKWFSVPQILHAAQSVITQQVNLRTNFYTLTRVSLYTGIARFRDQHTVDIWQGRSVRNRLTADHIVIATGSSPYRPTDIDFQSSRIYDSDSILTIEHTPRTLIIYGAGVIACEYASIFSGLGVKVDLINPNERVLSFLDDEISEALSYHLRENGVLIRHAESYQSVQYTDKSVVIRLNSGKRIEADALLWCAGRSSNTSTLHLDKIQLEVNARGQIEVDDYYRTAIPHLYAVGDVIGWPSLASASYNQGRSAAAHFVGAQDHWFVRDVPTGIYTIPEISSFGKTERELTREKIPYDVGHALFKQIARAQITGEEVGMLKVLFHRKTLKILGIHCFGNQASEIIHIGQAIMKQKNGGNSLNYFVNTTFNYPTMAEAYRIAALNGLNRMRGR